MGDQLFHRIGMIAKTLAELTIQKMRELMKQNGIAILAALASMGSRKEALIRHLDAIVFAGIKPLLTAMQDLGTLDRPQIKKARQSIARQY